MTLENTSLQVVHENKLDFGRRKRSVCAEESRHQRWCPEEPDCLLSSLFPGHGPASVSTWSQTMPTAPIR